MSLRRIGLPTVVCSLLLAACSAEEAAPPTPQSQDPDPGTDLLVVFDAQDEGGNCVINYSVYVSADAGIKRVGSDVITGDIMGGSGMGMRDLEADGILKGEGFDRTIEGMACADVEASTRPFQCFADLETTVDCPPMRVAGAEAFASFEQRKF